MKVVPVAAETLHVVKDKVVEAAHVSVEKTQEVLNEYVLPTAQAGIEKTQEVFNEYVVPTAAAGKQQRFVLLWINSYYPFLGAEVVKVCITN